MSDEARADTTPTAGDRIDALSAERKALPLLSLRRWKAARELRRLILAAAASGGRR